MCFGFFLLHLCETILKITRRLDSRSHGVLCERVCSVSGLPLLSNSFYNSNALQIRHISFPFYSSLAASQRLRHDHSSTYPPLSLLKSLFLFSSMKRWIENKNKAELSLRQGSRARCTWNTHALPSSSPVRAPKLSLFSFPFFIIKIIFSYY